MEPVCIETPRPRVRHLTEDDSGGDPRNHRFPVRSDRLLTVFSPDTKMLTLARTIHEEVRADAMQLLGTAPGKGSDRKPPPKQGVPAEASIE